MVETFNTTHAVVHLSITETGNTTLPVIIELEDPANPRIAHSAAKYARYLQRENHASYESIAKYVHVIGKLRDYYLLIRGGNELEQGDMATFLDDFLYALDTGSVLGWKAATNTEYLMARTAVADYVKFLANLPSGWNFTDTEYRFIEGCRQAYTGSSHAHESLLFHTKRRSKKKKAGRKRNTVGLRQYRPFPPHLVDDLIQETENIRDKNLFSFAAFGGRRVSEYLHMFLSDAEIIGKELRVSLRHPSLSPMEWINVGGQKTHGTRYEYLKSVFNLTPRTEHGAQPSAVGWKGIKFDDLARMCSDVYFIREAGVELASLHRQYIHDYLPRLPRGNHPYYFVCESGQPLTVKAAEKQFRLACKRLEKKHGISLNGYGIHSLRHYYGFFHADVLRNDLLMICHYMGHMSLSSTAVYAHISPDTARKALAAAGEKAKHEGRIAMTPQERERIQELFKDYQVPRLELDLKRLGTTMFGELDTGKVKRRLR